MDDCFSTNRRKNGDSLDYQEWISEIKKRLTPNPGRPGVWEPPDYHGDLYSRSIPLGLRLLLRPRPFPDRWFEKVEFSARCSNNKIIEWSWSTWKFSLKIFQSIRYTILYLIPWVYFFKAGNGFNFAQNLGSTSRYAADIILWTFFFLWRKLCFVAGFQSIKLPGVEIVLGSRMGFQYPHHSCWIVWCLGLVIHYNGFPCFL